MTPSITCTKLSTRMVTKKEFDHNEIHTYQKVKYISIQYIGIKSKEEDFIMNPQLSQFRE